MFDFLSRVIELCLSPFDRLPESVALTAISVITGAVLLLIVRVTTPQAFVARARDRMVSAVYETRLFLDSPRRLLVAQARLLGFGFVYLGSLVPALALMAVPLLVVYQHLDARFGRSPLSLETPTVLCAELRPGNDPRALTLAAPAGVTVSTTRVGTQKPPRAFFRVEVARRGIYDVTFRLRGAVASKSLVATERAPIGTERVRGASNFLSASVEPALSTDGPFERLTVFHENRTDTWLGMRWWLYWLLVSTLGALVLRKPFKVNV